MNALNLEELRKRREIAEAEKAAIEAELSRDEVRKKLADQADSSGPTQEIATARLDAARISKAQAEADKAKSEAEKAQAEAKLAAQKAVVGVVPASGISGAVKVEEGASSFETSLLAANAAITASTTIARAVSAALPSPDTKVYVFAASEFPSFQAATGFLARRAMVHQGLVEAISSAELGREAAASPTQRQESFAAVGLALEATAGILSYFRSDFEVRGKEVASDDVLLAKAVIGALLTPSATATSNPKPAVFSGASPNTAGTMGLLDQQLASLEFQHAKGIGVVAQLEDRIAEIQRELASNTSESSADQEIRRRLEDQQKRHQWSMTRLKAAIARFDAFIDSLAATGASSSWLHELVICRAFEDPQCAALVVKLDKAGGSSYVQKNLWTTLFGMPFKVMGGVITSFTLLDGKTGSVLASQVVPVHGGFHKVTEVKSP